MKRYRVRLEGFISTVVVVEAKSKEEAKDIAPNEVDPSEIDWNTIEIVD